MWSNSMMITSNNYSVFFSSSSGIPMTDEFYFLSLPMAVEYSVVFQSASSLLFDFGNSY